MQFCALFFMTSLWTAYLCDCQTYENAVDIFTSKLTNTNYSAEVRPLNDQSQAMQVTIGFSLLNIIEVDEVTQSFVCNGAVTMSWIDERLQWTPANFGNMKLIHPQPKLIWRPRTILTNTLNARDLFEDDFSPVTVTNTGATSWTPGSVFPFSCTLDMTKYPFDTQLCTMQFVPMGFLSSELVYVADGNTGFLTFYTENGEWDLLSLTTSAVIQPSSGNSTISVFNVSFSIKRRPAFQLINIILPVVLLSGLNLLVFTIPVESGEKISYGITVLLALTVFMSMIGSQLPNFSDNLPYVTIYLFCLLVVSVLTVVVCIIIVFFHHMEERQEARVKADSKLKGILKKFRSVKPIVKSLEKDQTECSVAKSDDNPETLPENNLNVKHKDFPLPPIKDDEQSLERESANKYKIIGKYIDFISFIVFTLIWLIITLCFFIAVKV